MTQVLPFAGPSVAAWNGTAAQKRILITGGAGFIGSHLVDRLVGGAAQTNKKKAIAKQNAALLSLATRARCGARVWCVCMWCV